MTDLRALVTGLSEVHILARLRRAQAVLHEELATGVAEIVVIARHAPQPGTELAAAIATSPATRLVIGHGLREVQLLDVGLHIRPLPDMVGVVGEDTTWLADAVVSLPLLLGAGVCAAIAHDAHDVCGERLPRQGGVFAAGPLCVAGGFTGDGPRPIVERLAGLGYSTLELPSTSPAVRSGRPHRDAELVDLAS